MANVKPIIEQKENKAEVGILFFYRKSKECQCQQGSLKYWEISSAKNGVRFLSLYQGIYNLGNKFSRG